jgi:hypothetical protein
MEKIEMNKKRVEKHINITSKSEKRRFNEKRI